MQSKPLKEFVDKSDNHSVFFFVFRCLQHRQVYRAPRQQTSIKSCDTEDHLNAVSAVTTCQSLCGNFRRRLPNALRSIHLLKRSAPIHKAKGSTYYSSRPLRYLTLSALPVQVYDFELCV